MAKTKKFRHYNPKQVMLLPPSLSDWLRPGHPVYFVSEVVDGFDLSAIYQGYTELRGYPPYEPGLTGHLFAIERATRKSRISLPRSSWARRPTHPEPDTDPSLLLPGGKGKEGLGRPVPATPENLLDAVFSVLGFQAVLEVVEDQVLVEDRRVL